MGVEEILYVDADTKKSTLLKERPMSKGLFGKTLEDALQNLLRDHADLLPGGQISPGAEPPPKFFLLCREMPIGSWSLDHLFVDQYGVLTLVESKLFQNPEQRREVVGQIIEYAANAESAWSSEALRQSAANYHQISVDELDERLAQRLFEGSASTEDFWGDVDKKLERRELRLIIAADRLNPHVRRLIEFLNSEFKTIEILGLEITCYVHAANIDSSPSGYVIVPRIVGQTQVSSQKTATTIKKLWVSEILDGAFSDLQEPLRSRLMDLKRLASDAGRFSEPVRNFVCEA